jgi:hypothetical protein
MRRWRTTEHENSLPGRKSFTFSTRTGYFQSSAVGLNENQEQSHEVGENCGQEGGANEAGD